jgi:folate-dependent phosphoribosylglycinamide formyltransferase PurN
MRIVFYAREGFEGDALFNYLFANVASEFPDCRIVAVKRAAPGGLSRTASRFRRTLRQRGVLQTVEMLTSKPLQKLIMRSHQSEVERRLRALPRPAVRLPTAEYVQDTNGPESVRVISGERPDVIIQAGAGILRRQIFSIPRLGTLNLHHGIAPLIRGVQSIYWGLYEKRDNWLGATVHFIDEGIDTGGVLAHAAVERRPGETFPSLFARATESGTIALRSVLRRLEAGERWTIAPFAAGSAYRSSISGWRMALVELRLWKERRARTPAGESAADSATHRLLNS